MHSFIKSFSTYQECKDFVDHLKNRQNYRIVMQKDPQISNSYDQNHDLTATNLAIKYTLYIIENPESR